MHALVHRTVQKAEARYKLSQELLLYHMKVPDIDVKNMLGSKVLANMQELYPSFANFEFSPRDVDDQTSIYLAMRMFFDLNFITTFQIREDKLVRFLLLVQKGYRHTPYHNWDHAFSVTHFAYACLKNLRLMERKIVS